MIEVRATPLQTPEIGPAVPNVDLRTTHYYRDGSFAHSHGEPYVSELEDHAMDMCLDLSDQALQDGNPPVGAVLIDTETGQLTGARTIDKTDRRLFGHAETIAYEMQLPQMKRGDDLSNHTLVTTAQPCNTCSSPYAEGKIGKVVYAAPRWAVFQVAGIMRRRSINMHELLVDGDTETVVVEGYRAEESLSRFVLWKLMKDAGHVQA